MTARLPAVPSSRRLAAALIVGLSSAAAAQQGPLRGFDAYTSAAIKAWGAPGLAVAVIRNDSVVLARGYGVRELGKSDPVTANTVFAVGSTTKAFTAALIGTLVDAGKLSWDDPVTKLYPGFQLYDPYVTREITIRDLLTHRSGLSRGDRLWSGSGVPREDVIRRVRFLKPSWSFRSTFGYQNIMFLTAGEIAGKLYGNGWDAAVAEKIFTPLGMTRTVTSTNALKGMDDVATPHERIDNVVTPVEWLNIDNIGPAGSINSSVTDMAQWVRMQLGKGMYGGRKVLEPRTVKEMHTLQMHMSPSETDEKLYPESHLNGYGLGWFLRDYRGLGLVSHGGAIRGMRAFVGLVPEKNLGVVVLTNLPETTLPAAIGMRVIDQHLAGTPKDWSARYLAESKAARDRAAADRQKTIAARVPGTSPTLALDRYAATYADSMYGEIRIAKEAEGLTMSFGPYFTGDLKHWHYDTFESVWRNKAQGRGTVSFIVDSRGQVTALDIPGLATFSRVLGSGSVASTSNP
ncbi:MAG TPA: serine hydrolase [Gemmatimonadales bacterium]|nr:serine hydrolase [Gemmatimonadales bacterium]